MFILTSVCGFLFSCVSESVHHLCCPHSPDPNSMMMSFTFDKLSFESFIFHKKPNSCSVYIDCRVFASMSDGDATSPSRHPCDRVCVAGATPMECSYTFVVELYNTLSKACYDCPQNITDCDREHCIAGDGMEKGLITINR